MFVSERLEVAPVYIRGGPVVIAALTSGDVDVAIMAGTTAVTSISRGADLVVVGCYTSQIDQVLMGGNRSAFHGVIFGAFSKPISR